MRILLPIDGSSFSNAAVAFIASRDTLILNHSANVELLNVQYPVPARAARFAGSELVRSYHEAEANKVIKPALATLKRAGLRVSARYVVGSPGSEVARVAASDAADLIVMGSHGHTGFKSLLFGSVTNAVLASCDTPLLVLRGPVGPKKGPNKDSLKVGIALDGSKYGMEIGRASCRERVCYPV